MKKRQLVHLNPKSWNRVRLHDLLQQIRGRKILVIGDVGIDRYTMGRVERISPEAPVPIVFVESEAHKLGLAANVADNIRELRASPMLVGVIGQDRGADDFKSLMKKTGVNFKLLVTDPKRRTVLKERVVSDSQQLLRVDYETLGSMSAQTERKLMAVIRANITKCDAVILQDYAKGLVSESLARSVFEMAKRAHKLVAVDPNERTQVSVYRGATLLTPNAREAERLTGILIRSDEALIAVGEKLLKLTQAKTIVITRGREGMAIFESKSHVVRLIPTFAQEVYDVSGAGDTVIAVLTLALSSGATIEEAAVLGNLAAGVEVGKRGTATVTPEEITHAMSWLDQITN